MGGFFGGGGGGGGGVVDLTKKALGDQAMAEKRNEALESQKAPAAQAVQAAGAAQETLGKVARRRTGRAANVLAGAAQQTPGAIGAKKLLGM